MAIRSIKTFLADRPAWQYFVAGLVTLGIVVYIDVTTDPDLFLSPFYMLTVVMVAWGAGRRWGVLISIITTVCWYFALQHQNGPRHKVGYLIIDVILRAAFYIFATHVIAGWRDARRRLQEKVDERTAALQSEIRERELAQTALHALTAELAAAEDAQRRQLAHDIHDAVGQNLSLLKLNLEGLRRDTFAADSAQVQRRLDDEIRTVDGLIQQTRTLTFEVYPAPLDDLGLVAALEWQAEEFQRRSNVNVIISEHGQRLALPMPVAHYLFRAIKELINNALKHGSAKNVIVSLHWLATGVRAVVDDDGCGFAAEANAVAGERRGLGLPGIRERLTAFRGSMQIESQAKAGSRIILEVPLLA